MTSRNDTRRNVRQKNKIMTAPYPFVKWAGGKRQLISQIIPCLPKSFKNYIEPFVGGGALFFHLLPKKAVLIDNNASLINVYRVIKENVEDLIAILGRHQNNPEYYYEIRNVDRTEEFKKWSDVEKASRFVYLNRCCYNGLYRVNSKGFFNVPFGKYKNPKFCDEKNLRAVNKALQNVKLISSSFERCLDFAEKDDLIYIDPPYHPISKTASFTSYTSDNFGENDQKLLKKVVDELNNRGCKVLISNSFCEFITDLYEEYVVKKVNARRAINCNGSKRGEVSEVLIMNYEPRSSKNRVLQSFYD
ncbi:MAG: DNA adenine methylase [Candidatus Helarchaeota archaeon]